MNSRSGQSAAAETNDAGEATLRVSIWRGVGEHGSFVEYAVPARRHQSVLDIVTWVQRNLAPDLAYRFACRVGMCGSCAMMVNGRPRWTCRTHASVAARNGRIEIAPLRNFTPIRDLACDMSDFFDKWHRGLGRFVGDRNRDDDIAGVRPGSARRRQVDAAIECINCGVCHAACDVVSWRADYLGPAVLNRVWSLQMDERDRAGRARLAIMAREGGCLACHSQAGCTTHCPKGLDPSRSIAGLKKQTVLATVKGSS